MTHATSAQHPKAKNLFADAWHGLIKNKMAVVGACVLLFFIFVAIFADFIAPYPADAQNWDHIMEPPSSQFLLGTDSYGRCVFSHCVRLTHFAARRFCCCGVFRHWRRHHRRMRRLFPRAS